MKQPQPIAGASDDKANWRPPHAYVPGRSPRHPETLFDDLKADVAAYPMERLNESAAWTSAMRFLHEGYYWEAHEVLEPVWMACRHNSAERALVQGIIQFANAALKEKMGRSTAARRLSDMSEDLIEEAFRRGGSRVLGYTYDDIRKLLTWYASRVPRE